MKKSNSMHPEDHPEMFGINLFEIPAIEERERKSKMAAVKISSLELENVKRVKAVRLQPTENGLTIIGGKNNQGKTSVLDAIAYALGGANYKPSNTKREGSMIDPHMKVVLSNGIVVERKGKNSTLQVTDPSGKKQGQALLDSFITTFALDLPKFIQSNDKEKAKVLLQIIGIGDQLAQFDLEEKRLADERLAIGRIAKEKTGHAEQMVQWDGVPKEPISMSDLIKQQQDILARNGLRQQWKAEYNQILADLTRTDDDIDRMTKQIADLKAKRTELEQKAKLASKSPKELEMESTSEIEASIQNIESINAKVRDNLEKEKAQMEADSYSQKYRELSDQIEKLRDNRMKLLEGSDMPLKGLSVEDGILVFNGQPWDNMSGSDQLRVATAIVRKIQPNCGFVLLDKLEQMDLDTLSDFSKWLEKEGLQAIATRVSTGEECTIYIEDGYSVDHNGKKTAEDDLKPAGMMKKAEPEMTETVKWEAGKF